MQYSRPHLEEAHHVKHGGVSRETWEGPQAQLADAGCLWAAPELQHLLHQNEACKVRGVVAPVDIKQQQTAQQQAASMVGLWCVLCVRCVYTLYTRHRNIAFMHNMQLSLCIKTTSQVQ